MCVLPGPLLQSCSAKRLGTEKLFILSNSDPHTKMRGLLSPVGLATRAVSSRVMQTTSARLFSCSSFVKMASQASKPVSSETTFPGQTTRKTGKPILSRKTFLVDYYKHMNDTNEIILYIHHNNLVKNDTIKIRSELQKLGVQMLYLRNNIYKVYLRSANEEDPAASKTSKKNRHVQHPLSILLNGPTAAIAIEKCDPTVVEKILKVLKPNSDKLMLMGARVETSLYNPEQVNAFKDLPSKEQLQAQLAGLLAYLGGAGLVRTLETNGTALYLTLDQRSKDMDPSAKETTDDA